MENGQYADLLEKADRAHCLGLGAGAIVYLRTILEAVTKQTANAAGVPLRTSKNKRRPFKDLLTDVDRKCRKAGWNTKRMFLLLRCHWMMKKYLNRCTPF